MTSIFNHFQHTPHTKVIFSQEKMGVIFYVLKMRYLSLPLGVVCSLLQSIDTHIAVYMT